MEQHHFIIHPKNIHDNHFHLNENEGHHLAKVARVRVGDQIILLDRNGTAYEAKVTKINNGEVRGTILSTFENYHESLVQIHLGIGILKGSKMDAVIEKSTELGVASISPLVMKCNIKQRVNLLRLNKIAESAIKQCGRGKTPKIHEPIDFYDWVSSMSVNYGFVADHHNANISIWSWLDDFPEDVHDLWVLIGPEGGFHHEEIALLKKNNIQFVSLGPRRLRSETAAISTIAICDSFFSARRSYA